MPTDMIYELVNPPADNDSLLLWETLFHNANGYIGVRSCYEEGYPAGYTSIRGAYINGVYDFAPMKQAESLYGLVEEKQTILNVADPQGIELALEGERFTPFVGEVLESRRTLNMEKGTTARFVHWKSPQGKEVQVTSTRMASFAKLPLFLIQYKIKSINYSGDITLTSTHKGQVKNYANPNDPRVAAESLQYLHLEKTEQQGDASVFLAKTSASGLHIATGVTHKCSKETQSTLQINGDTAVYTAQASIQAGEEITLYKYCVFTDSIRYTDCFAQAGKLLGEYAEQPPKELYKEQQEYLREYWEKAYLTIEGDDELSRAVRFNLYQMIASVGKDPHCNIAAKGLSGEGYEGHYFWDTEMYGQPFFNITMPEISRNLIAYRYSILEEARKNAKILGHTKGALYAWRTIMGKECSGYFPSGTAQYHINSDIAYSVVAYYLATGDATLLEEMGAEILFETARLWLDVGAYHDGEFHIHCVTGPDEYTCLVNNNYYTNLSAKYNLEWAVKAYHLLEKVGKTDCARRIGLTQQEIEEFSSAAEKMFLPYDETLGINPQDDSFLQKKVWDIAATPQDKFPLLLHYHPLHLYRYQVCKQADTVLAHFLFEDAQPMATIENSFAYYEKVTTHDSSLSTCIFSIMASKLGQAEKAYSYFGNSAKLDLFNTHNNTKDGIHTANMGGTYMAVVYGFGGLRIKEDGIYFAPSLPEKWNAYSFAVRYKNNVLQVDVNRRQTVFTMKSGQGCSITVNGKQYDLQDTLVLESGV